MTIMGKRWNGDGAFVGHVKVNREPLVGLINIATRIHVPTRKYDLGYPNPKLDKFESSSI
jgi:hypothetical protein